MGNTWHFGVEDTDPQPYTLGRSQKQLTNKFSYDCTHCHWCCSQSKSSWSNIIHSYQRRLPTPVSIKKEKHTVSFFGELLKHLKIEGTQAEKKMFGGHRIAYFMQRSILENDETKQCNRITDVSTKNRSVDICMTLLNGTPREHTSIKQKIGEESTMFLTYNISRTECHSSVMLSHSLQPTLNNSWLMWILLL